MKGFGGFLAEAIEQVNAAWWTLDLILVTFLFYYLYTGYTKSKLPWHSIVLTWWDGKMPIHVQAAAAILVFHIGDLFVRFTVWWLRHEVNTHGVPVGIQDWSTYIILVFAFIAGLGMLCQLRVFAGLMIGRWVWVGSALAAIFMASITRLLP